jgi:pyruvate kinase
LNRLSAPALNSDEPVKIIATLGPAVAEDGVLRRLLAAGVDLVRLNFSHGDHASHQAAIEQVRRLEEESGRFVGIIADLQGPKIRTGELEGGGPVMLVAGAALCITTEAVVGTSARVSTTYRALPEDVKPGDRILMDDGLLEVRVTAVEPPAVRCEVVTGGELGEHKGLNLPGVAVSSPALTAKDRADLEFALRAGVDYVAVSFVRSAVDVAVAKDTIASLECDVPVIAKLEKPEAIADLERVVAAADAVMIARGDLGVELDTESVPMVQKQIIRECFRQRTPVITATQMLDSMREHPRPTRAEASDVANAVLDGTDAVMLSGETAVGKYPVESVETMGRIIRSAGAEMFRGPHLHTAAEGDRTLSFSDAISRGAAELAEDLETAAIVAFTQSGSTARLTSKCRPRVPILAATPLPRTARRCTLYWGVHPVLLPAAGGDTDELMEAIQTHMRDHGLASPGDAVVVVAGTPVGRVGSTNMIKLQVIR